MRIGQCFVITHTHAGEVFSVSMTCLDSEVPLKIHLKMQKIFLV